MKILNVLLCCDFYDSCVCVFVNQQTNYTGKMPPIEGI